MNPCLLRHSHETCRERFMYAPSLNLFRPNEALEMSWCRRGLFGVTPASDSVDTAMIYSADEALTSYHPAFRVQAANSYIDYRQDGGERMLVSSPRATERQVVGGV